MNRLAFISCMLLPVVMSLAVDAEARTAIGASERLPSSSALALPAYCNTAHTVGRIALGVSNDGTVGTRLAVSGSQYDCFSGLQLPSCEYPQGTEAAYLFGAALWIGAVTGQDTLVSTGADGWSSAGNEFHPDEPPLGNMQYRSILDPTSPAYFGAVSEQDFVAAYADTCWNCPGVGTDPVDLRPHLPLNLKVNQSSYAWSQPQVEDIVFLEYQFENMGGNALSGLWLGMYVDSDAHAYADFRPGGGAQDDHSGYLAPPLEFPDKPGCAIESDRGLAWSADNNGDLDQTVLETVPHVLGFKWLNRYESGQSQNFNWWISNNDANYDFGPMRRDNLRDFGTGGTGTPEGDRNKYYLLGNGETDYDQVLVAAIGGEDSVWLPPPAIVPATILAGTDTRYLLSVGPFDLAPGEELSLAMAVVAGENLHTEASNFDTLMYDAYAYLDGLDFSDLSTNGLWAEWVYDNPGVDTDSDGYSGEFSLCDGDTVWFRGDGVPDWRAAVPPDPPPFWVEPEVGALRIRFNGAASELSRDWMSREYDFEGYRVYLSNSGSPADFQTAAGYDVEDYMRFFWDTATNDWAVDPTRWFADELRCQYAPDGCTDAGWHPLNYPRQNPFIWSQNTDSIFYFEPVFVNASRLGTETPIVKIYPAAPEPPYARPADVPVDSLEQYLTDDGYFKFYEYELVLDNLLAEHEYLVAVSAYDHGAVADDESALESEYMSLGRLAAPLSDPSCCVGLVGNVNCGVDQVVDMGDVSLLVDYLYISREVPCCLAEADVNRSAQSIPTGGDITIGDLAMLVDHLFIDLQPLLPCE